MIKGIGPDCKMLTGRPQMIEVLIPQQHSVELFKRLFTSLNCTSLLGASQSVDGLELHAQGDLRLPVRLHEGHNHPAGQVFVVHVPASVAEHEPMGRIQNFVDSRVWVLDPVRPMQDV